MALSIGRALSGVWIAIAILSGQAALAEGSEIEGTGHPEERAERRANNPEAVGSGPGGSVTFGDADVEWRLNHLGPCSPEATFLVRNRSGHELALLIEVAPRVCKGAVLHRAVDHTYRCLGEIDRKARMRVAAESWNAFVLPLRGNFEGEESASNCAAVVSLRGLAPTLDLGEVKIEIPVPPGGWRFTVER